jgi:two-component system nitrate/nitrite sensor histidine kinase NarX
LYDQAERLATSEERQRIAAEMHDGLAQTLSYTKLAVNQSSLQIEIGQLDAAVQTLDRVNSALDQAIEDTRRAIASLQEQGPLTETLQEQLASLAKEFSRESPAVEWSSKVQAPVMLPRQESRQVLRVAQEAVVNVRRHAQASRINLCLAKGEGEYMVIVEDDGKGFDPDTPVDGDGRQHFGLNIMQARAARIAGRLDIQSAPGAGTRVSLYWPARSEAT